MQVCPAGADVQKLGTRQGVLPVGHQLPVLQQLHQSCVVSETIMALFRYSTSYECRLVMDIFNMKLLPLVVATVSSCLRMEEQNLHDMSLGQRVTGERVQL